MSEIYYETAETGGPRLMQRAAAILPLARRVPKSPFFLGAAALGVLGVIAWRNRERIRQTAAPMLQQAADRARPMLQEAADRARPMLQSARERLPWMRPADLPAEPLETLQ